ncbi:MAG: hypothetical protein KGL00_01190 [Gammaproteobacteria bacterium]|nr:hypothetical protein [Gammaproteobacteria bacterium]MDE2139202.1 hypothetical protein [Gammaproteobacteria bacterium]MDE2272786.1 hypothetical protein [Gammaproteobacteria bacterium]
MKNLVENVKEVDRLTDIHSLITTKGRGRKHNVAVLHKGSIVLLVACWEAFIEDLANAALEHMISAAKDYSIFPGAVLDRVGSKCSGPNAWKLAGEGWRTELRSNLKEVLAKTTGTLNTPKTEQVDNLFEKTIGLDGISGSWKWKGESVAQSRAALDKVVSLRGSIAHRVKSATAVHLSDVTSYREFIFRLCVRSHNRVREFIASQVGESPWEKYWFGETS